MKIFGVQIDFAPLRGIPLKRRLQTLCIFYFYCEFFFLPFIYTFLLISLLFTNYFWITLIYFTHYYYTTNLQNTGGNKQKWVKNFVLWKYCYDYFPLKVVKTSDLDKDRQYIFGLHPHGITSTSSVLNFCYGKSEFFNHFPDMQVSLATLNAQFVFPIHRDLLLSLGLCSSSKESISYILNKKENVALVVGGAPEALSTAQDVVRLYLKNRKGFIKLALKNGASLVPVFQFGENEIFKQKEFSEDSYFRKFQRCLTDLLSFSPPVFHGRGMFNYTFGFIPFRKQIVTVVGKPIYLDKCENPTTEQIEKLHDQYVESLMNLFNEWNPTYGYYKDAKLEIY